MHVAYVTDAKQTPWRKGKKALSSRARQCCRTYLGIKHFPNLSVRPLLMSLGNKDWKKVDETGMSVLEAQSTLGVAFLKKYPVGLSIEKEKKMLRVSWALEIWVAAPFSIWKQRKSFGDLLHTRLAAPLNWLGKLGFFFFLAFLACWISWQQTEKLFFRWNNFFFSQKTSTTACLLGNCCKRQSRHSTTDSKVYTFINSTSIDDLNQIYHVLDYHLLSLGDIKQIPL